jgi:hypothetical protein
MPKDRDQPFDQQLEDAMPAGIDDITQQRPKILSAVLQEEVTDFHNLAHDFGYALERWIEDQVRRGEHHHIALAAARELHRLTWEQMVWYAYAAHDELFEEAVEGQML